MVFLLRMSVALAVVSFLTASIGLADEKLKVGFVYIGPVGDHGWTYQHDQARKAMEQVYTDQVETIFVESVEDGPDSQRTIERLARQGAELIFATSFGYMDPTIKVARRFPNVKFEHATGYKRANNVSTYNARFYEGRYVSGKIAARVSTSGIAGYIASFPIPEVVMGINAFTLGAQSVNPDFKVKIIWVNSWFDPGKEADAAKVLISQGADIISQHTDSTAALQIAGEEGVFAFGQATDMIRFAPKSQLTAILNNWTPYYIERVGAVLNDSWKSQDTWAGMTEGAVAMAPYTNMPDDVSTLASETVKEIMSGKLHPFTGPVYRQDGTLALADGEVIDDEALLGMNWYVKGIDGTLPK